MKNNAVNLWIGLIFAVLPSYALEITIVESRAGGTNVNWYAEAGGNWANSSVKSTAAGTTQAAPPIGSRFATTDGAAFTVSPILQDGATYTVDITHPDSSNIPNAMDVAVAVAGGTMTVTNTGAFGRPGNNTWERVGSLTLDPGVTTPTITFTKLSPTAAPNRFYADAVRFTLLEPCLTVPDIKTVNGPLAAGQTFVDVAGVTNTATAVAVYADGVKIGEKTSGVTAGVNRVTTSALVKGQVITGTQTIGGIESCVPGAGQHVGSGANPPSFGISVTIRQTNLTDSAIGVNGGAPGSILKLIGATNVTGSLLAPVGTKIFSPSSQWQTVQFHRGDNPDAPIDPTFNWNVADPTFGNTLAYNFGVFDALIFTMENADTGPFAIYIDEFKNGDTRVQGFEGAALGQAGSTFTQPSFSGTTAAFLLAQPPGTVNPNVSMVTNNTSEAGAHSLFVSWQFNTTNGSACLRLPAVATSAGSSPNPIVDLRLPITFRMLILPVGEQPPPLAADATSGPGNQRVIRGGNATMRFNYRGTAPFTFQWRRNGVDVPNATNATLTINNAQPSDAGSYTAVVSNSLGSDESPAGNLTVDDVPYTDVMTPLWRLTTGSRPYLANDNLTRSIAYNHISGNLLVASRSGNSNAIYVLDGATGAFKYVLQPPPGGYTGGTLVLNQVVVANDDVGTVYAANLTDNGSTTAFKLYKWFGDHETEVGALVWEGNPSNDPNIALRWGDAMTVRGGVGAHQIIVSSRTGTMLSMIQPDFPASLPVTLDITDAAPNSFRLGLAIAGNTLWGKMTGLPLLQVLTDENFSSATIVNSFSGLGNMGPIGVNAAGTLLGGVFIDNPDHLRLFDISTPGVIEAVDTELFPSDNANGNATGAVAFGNNVIYALDSNNGLIAMTLDTTCYPARATIERDGSDVLVSWTRSGYRLEGTTDLGGTWESIEGASPVRVSAATGLRFFRLVCP